MPFQADQYSREYARQYEAQQQAHPSAMYMSYPSQPRVMIPQSSRYGASVQQAPPPFSAPPQFSTSPHQAQVLYPQHYPGSWPQQTLAQYSPPYQPARSDESIAQVLQRHHHSTPQEPTQQYYAPQQGHRGIPQEYHPVTPGYHQAQLHAQAPYQPQLHQQLRPQQRSATKQVPTQAHPSPQPPVSRHPPQPYPSQNSSQSSAMPAAPQAPQRRNVAYIRIPVQQSAPMAAAQPRSPKRRRSNDGDIIHVMDHQPASQHSNSLKKPVAVVSSPLTELPSSQIPPTPTPALDTCAILLSLADEYALTAYSLCSGKMIGENLCEAQLNDYYALMSTAMGCLESVLKNHRLSDPRKEARVRLRLAALLHEETENSMESEEVLSKGIALCERRRLHDLKYAMHHLLVRVLSRSNVKAALKAVDKLIPEVEALRLLHWLYAFRFLSVSLSLQRSDQSDYQPILKHLTAISASAENQRHVAVQIAAACLEAFVHLRTGAVDATELAQRSIAVARTHQLSTEMKRLPQLSALLDCLDLACAITQFQPKQVEMKMYQMQKNLDSASRDVGWRKDSALFLPLGLPAPNDIGLDAVGILSRLEDGEIALTLTWLTRSQLYPLGYLLSGIARMHKAAGDSKAETFLAEGLKLCQSLTAVTDIPQSLSTTTTNATRNTSMVNMVRLQQVFAHCTRNQWLAAEKALQQVSSDVRASSDKLMQAMLTFLDATIKHANGDIEKALSLYTAQLSFAAESKNATALKDIQTLATLNSIIILRKQGEEDEAEMLLTAVESYCLAHPNKSLLSAFYLIKAAMQGPNSIIKTKQFLQSSIQAAQTTQNQQLLCVAMNIMSNDFFHNIVGNQAIKSARAARTLGKRANSSLWTAVADGLYGSTLELCGEPSEAEVAKIEANKSLDELTPALRERLQKDQDDSAI